MRRAVAASCLAAAIAPAVAADTTATRPRSAPHTSPITAIALAPDGAAALTLQDSPSALRFWAALDGSVAPQAVTAPRPTSFALDMGPQGAYTLATLDAAGGAKIFAGDATGVRELGSWPATDPLLSLTPLHGQDALIAIARDMTLRLVATSGQELARLEQRGFGPRRLCVSTDGTRALAIEPAVDAVRPIAIRPGTAEPISVGERVSIPIGAGPSGAGSACSPDARLWTFVRQAAEEQKAERKLDAKGKPLPPPAPKLLASAELVVIDVERGEHRVVALPLEMLQAAIHFVDARVVVGTPNNQMLSSWRIDLDTGRVTPVLALETQVPSLLAIQAASGRRVTTRATLLSVDDLERNERSFLGHEGFIPALAAISPGTTDRAVAWASGTGSIVVHPIGGGTPVVIPSDLGRHISFVTFLDDDHLLVAEDQSNVKLIEWRTSREIDRIDSTTWGVAFELERTTGLFRMTSGAQHRLYRVSARDGFAGPYLVADGGTTAGLVANARDGEVVFWTFDGKQTRRVYRLDEVRAGLTRDEMMNRGTKIDTQRTPIAADGRGSVYATRFESGSAVVDIFDEDGDRTSVKLGTSDVQVVAPSRDGRRFVAWRQGAAIQAFDVRTAARLWSYSPGANVHATIWSPDGRYLAVPNNLRSVVLDGITGEIVVERCAGSFFSEPSPPSPQRITSGDHDHLCE